MARIKFHTTVVTSQYGTMMSGDILQCSDEFAKHIVEECKGAKYLDQVVEQAAPEVVEDVAPKARRKAK